MTIASNKKNKHAFRIVKAGKFPFRPFLADAPFRGYRKRFFPNISDQMAMGMIMKGMPYL
jgi:hypothetical protein